MKADESRITKKLMEEQKKEKRDTTWYKSIERAAEKYEIALEEYKEGKATWKKYLKTKIGKKLEEEINGVCRIKSKARTIREDEYTKKNYLGKLPLSMTRSILRYRLHMCKIPGNYKGINIKQCPLCDIINIETEHYFTCNRCYELAKTWGVQKEDMSSQEIHKMKNLAGFFTGVEEMVEPLMEIRMKRRSDSTE